MSQFGHDTTGKEVVATYADKVKGRIFAITGTSANGLGAQTALDLATQAPAQIILISRSKAKTEPVIEQIKAINPAIRVVFVPCELTDQDSVRAAAKTINEDAAIPHIDVLINNAGIMNIKTFTTDAKGNEIQFSSNHLGHFLLTNLLMPKIRASGPEARVVNLTSQGHKIGPVRFDDLTFGNGKTYDGWSGYGQSKSSNILFSVELSRRGVRSYAVHPGGIYTTGLATHLVDIEDDIKDLAETALRNTGVPFNLDSPKSILQGSSTTLVAALSPEVVGHEGAWLSDCQVAEAFAYATSPENAAKLWRVSEELVGEKFDF